MNSRCISKYQRLRVSDISFIRTHTHETIVLDDDSSIEVATTPCNYGGLRHWLVCPRCGQRRKDLFCDRDGWACRICLDLVYRSQQENRGWKPWHQRAMAVIWQVDPTFNDSAAKLAMSPAFSVWPNRPKGMHHKTYATLFNQFQICHAKYQEELAKSLEHFAHY